MKQVKDSLLKRSKQWLSPLKEMFLDEEVAAKGVSTELATAVLLVEVMKMDGNLKSSEEELLIQRLIHHFKLDHGAVQELARNAHIKLEEATDYHQFTKALNQQLSVLEKVDLIESLWMMAAVDGHIDAHENHLIRKIADLLHLRHSEFVRVKDRVFKRANL